MSTTRCRTCLCEPFRPKSEKEEGRSRDDNKNDNGNDNDNTMFGPKSMGIAASERRKEEVSIIR